MEYILPRSYLRSWTARTIHEHACTVFQMISKCHDFNALIPYEAIMLLHRILSNPKQPDKINSSNMELFLVTCLTIPWKLHSESFEIEKFLKEKKLRYTMQDVDNMQEYISENLEQKLKTVSPVCFLGQYSGVLDLPADFVWRTVCEIIIESQGDFGFGRIRPSVLSAAAILCVSKKLCPGQYEGYWSIMYERLSGSMEELAMAIPAVNQVFENKLNDLAPLTIAPRPSAEEHRLDCTLDNNVKMVRNLRWTYRQVSMPWDNIDKSAKDEPEQTISRVLDDLALCCLEHKKREWGKLPASLTDKILVRLEVELLRRVVGPNQARDLLSSMSLPGYLVQYDYDHDGILLCEIYRFCHMTKWTRVRHVELPVGEDHETMVALVGSAKGVLCFRLYREGRDEISLHVLNPVFGLVRDITFPSIKEAELDSIIYEFGYGLEAGEFKIVRIIDMPAQRIEIFRSPNNEWTELHIDWPTIHGAPLTMKRGPASVFQNRKFLFFGNRRHEKFPEAIVGFHIDDEVFDIVRCLDLVPIHEEPVLELLESNQLKITMLEEDSWFSCDVDLHRQRDLWYRSIPPARIPVPLRAIMRADLPERDIIEHRETLQRL